MRGSMKTFIRHLFTDGTNQTWDYSRVMGAVGLAVFSAISIHSYITHDDKFDSVSWATGFSIIVAAAIGSSKLPDKTLPSKE